MEPCGCVDQRGTRAHAPRAGPAQRCGRICSKVSAFASARGLRPRRAALERKATTARKGCLQSASWAQRGHRHRGRCTFGRGSVECGWGAMPTRIADCKRDSCGRREGPLCSERASSALFGETAEHGSWELVWWCSEMPLTKASPRSLNDGARAFGAGRADCLGEKVTAGSFPPFLPTTHSVGEVVGEVEAPRPRMYYYWDRGSNGTLPGSSRNSWYSNHQHGLANRQAFSIAQLVRACGC